MATQYIQYDLVTGQILASVTPYPDKPPGHVWDDVSQTYVPDPARPLPEGVGQIANTGARVDIRHNKVNVETGEFEERVVEEDSMEGLAAKWGGLSGIVAALKDPTSYDQVLTDVAAVKTPPAKEVDEGNPISEERSG